MKSAIAILTAAVLCGTAFAQQEPQSPNAPNAAAAPNAATQQPPSTAPAGPVPDIAAIFDKLDVNHDGKLTPDEAQAHPTVMAHFADADANHDGVVTKDEFTSAFRPQQ